MVGTIGAAGGGSIGGLANRLWFLAAAVVSGAAVGVATALLGGYVADRAIAPAIILAAFIAAIALLSVESHWLVRPPGLRRQVPVRILISWPAWAVSVNWGLQLGAGVLTHINSWAFWSFVVGLILVGNPFIGILAGAAYGMVRGLQPMICSHSIVASMAQLEHRLHAPLIVDIAVVLLVAERIAT